jgi:hypothetical protein
LRQNRRRVCDVALETPLHMRQLRFHGSDVGSEPAA